MAKKKTKKQTKRTKRKKPTHWSVSSTATGPAGPLFEGQVGAGGQGKQTLARRPVVRDG